MTFKHVIITRFSFRFKESDPKLPLLSEKRLDERIRIFEEFCFPSIAGQTNKNFDWILIVDPELSEDYRNRLMEIFEKFKSSRAYFSRGPRNFWLHSWNWETNRLSAIDWILPYITRNDIEGLDRSGMLDGEMVSNSYRIGAMQLVTTRLDDDDCLNKNFIQNIANLIRRPPRDLGQVKGFRFISYCHGYQYQVRKKILKRTRIPLIALGLTLITEVNKYPFSAYFGNHTKVGHYIRKPESHSGMLAMYQSNRDLPVTHQQILQRLVIIRGEEAMYVRNVHDFNLQKNIPRHKHQSADRFRMIQTVMKDLFNVKV